MAFERCYDEDLGTFPTHAESYQLERKGLAGTAGSQKNHIGVFIYAAIEDINYDQAVVMLVDSEQDAVLIAHLKRGERITTGSRRGKHISLARLKELFIQATNRLAPDEIGKSGYPYPVKPSTDAPQIYATPDFRVYLQ